MERTTVSSSIDVALTPAEAFEVVVGELQDSLVRLGVGFEPGADGRVVDGELLVGRVVAWESGTRIALEWRPADWQPDETTEVELRFDRVEGGTRVTFEHRDWGGLLADRGQELAGWFAGEVVAPLLQATAPARFAEWLTDRVARRPSGQQAREIYRDPLFHRPNFAVLLELLAPRSDDYLLEIGCGGGVLLHDALESGCRAAAVDHSPEMVRLAGEVNAEAIAAGRLEIVESSAADPLPFPDEIFTCATMTGVLGFLVDPVATLREMRRVLVSAGRLAILGSDPAWRGTPAAPEPFASRIRFYTDEELGQLARAAGFVGVRVERISLEPYAREAGVPDEYLALFAGAGAPFLLGRKG